MSVSSQTVVTDNHVITVSTTNLTYANIHNPYAKVILIDWPDAFLQTATFTVEIKACEMTNQ